MQNSYDTKQIELAAMFQNVGVYYPPAVGMRVFSRKKRGFWALKDVSFELYRGDVLGIIGSNGAGKTTTLRVLSGIIAPDRGNVNTYNNKITLLSINAGLAPYLSGRKNIMLIGLSLGIEREVILRAMDAIIEFSELGAFISEPVETYSSGMKARLGFSTALYLKPDIMLIDEGLGVGDKAFKAKSTKAIRENLAGNSTAVLTSHNDSTVRELCTKVLWIEKGVTMAFGNPDTVLQEYDKYCST